jgi:hypothetical protein
MNTRRENPMRVIGINASPRKKANTQTLVEAILSGAEDKGAVTNLVNLRELKMNGCLGCEGCKKHLGKCVQKDDLTPLLQKMTAYDAIIMGTPVYWYHVTSQFKMLVDRLYCFLEAGKKMVILISRGDPEPPEMFPQFYNHLDEWLNLIPLSLRAGKYEIFYQYGTGFERKTARNDKEILHKAKMTGAGLISLA